MVCVGGEGEWCVCGESGVCVGRVVCVGGSGVCVGGRGSGVCVGGSGVCVCACACVWGGRESGVCAVTALHSSVCLSVCVQVCAVQTSPSEVKVEYLRDTSTVLTLKTDIHIQALKCCKVCGLAGPA